MCLQIFFFFYKIFIMYIKPIKRKKEVHCKNSAAIEQVVLGLRALSLISFLSILTGLSLGPSLTIVSKW